MSQQTTSLEIVGRGGCVGVWRLTAYEKQTLQQIVEESRDFWRDWWQSPHTTGPTKSTLSRDIEWRTLDHEQSYDWIVEWGCLHCGGVHFSAGRITELARQGEHGARMVVRCADEAFASDVEVETGWLMFRLVMAVEIGPRSRLSSLAG